MSDRFRLFTDGGLEVYYAPFHHAEPNARVALIGLTPGFTQMEEAFRAAKDSEGKILSQAELFAHIDSTGSFSGPMRSNLVEMLDGIGLQRLLGIDTCLHLFTKAGRRTAHFTSIISAPAFKAGENYSGSPGLLSVPRLREWVLEKFSRELAALPDAIFVPLGRTADEAVTLLSALGKIDSRRCLSGFPHPSGANGHRKRLFELHRDRWREQLQSL
jgi:hypothetical protein